MSRKETIGTLLGLLIPNGKDSVLIKADGGKYIIDCEKIGFFNKDGLILQCDTFHNATQSDKVVALLKRLIREKLVVK